MPNIPAWALRLALVQFVLATSMGTLLLVRTAYPDTPVWAPPAGSHAELALMGFMLPFALGVAAWILPKSGAPPGRLHAFAFVLLHAAVLPAAFGTAWPWSVFAARAAQAVALVILLAHLVPRVRAATVQRRAAEPPAGHALPRPPRPERNADQDEQDRQDRDRDHVGGQGG